MNCSYLLLIVTVVYFHTRKIRSNPDFFVLSYQISIQETREQLYIRFSSGQTILKVRMVKTTKAVVESDFDYLIKNSINKKYAKQLKKQYKAGNIRLQVSYKLPSNEKTGSELDGETNFGIRVKRCLIKIKRSSATSEKICWRRAIVCA